VKRDPQEARSGESAASVAGSTAQQAFTAERQVVLGLLDQPDDASVESSNGDPYARRSHLPACWRLVMTKSCALPRSSWPRRWRPAFRYGAGQSYPGEPKRRRFAGVRVAGRQLSVGHALFLDVRKRRLPHYRRGAQHWGFRAHSQIGTLKIAQGSSNPIQLCNSRNRESGQSTCIVRQVDSESPSRSFNIRLTSRVVRAQSEEMNT
jgi:hypothetical protein